MSDSSSTLPPAGDHSGRPDVPNRSCELLGPTALIVQGLMGVLVILSLVYKRHRESPKRPWRIWLFDVSKQVVGQLFVHTFNLVVAAISSDHSATSNACISYFLHILVDTTFGVALIYVILHALTRLFSDKFNLKGFESGVYGDPPSVKYWFRQAALYILSLSAMKAVVVAFLFVFPGIYTAAEWLLKWTWVGGDDDVQVIVVMGVFPIMMNVIQFWLIDSIVKATSATSDALEIEQAEEGDRQPLFDVTDDEDEDHQDFRTEGTNRRRSLDSRGLNSRDDLSSTIAGVATPDEGKPAQSQPTDHAYPPSLSSSFSSDASSTHDSGKGPKLAKNLMKKTKRREPLTSTSQQTLPLAESSSVPRTPPPPAVEWSEDWEDSHEWNRDVNLIQKGADGDDAHVGPRSDS